MIQARFGVFETNSSSTHSICICTEEDYQRFLNGELVLDTWNDVLVDKETALKDNGFARGRYASSAYEIGDDWYNVGTFDEHFETPSGDKMVVFGAYGRND